MQMFHAVLSAIAGFAALGLVLSIGVSIVAVILGWWVIPLLILCVGLFASGWFWRLLGALGRE